MNKKNKMAMVAMATCAAVSCACVMTACGGAKDYSAYTYKSYAAEDWDAKTVSYQLYSDSTVNGPMGNNAEYLLNLYSDGGALLYQAGLWEYNADDAHWADQTNHIAYAYYGCWTEDGESITVRLISDTAGTSATVDINASTTDFAPSNINAKAPADFTGDHYDPPIEKLEYTFSKTGDNAYKFVMGDYNFLPMGVTNKMMGQALASKEGDEHASGSITNLSSEVKYATIADWVKSYSENEDGSKVEFPTKDAGM